MSQQTSKRYGYRAPADEVAAWVAGHRVNVAGTVCRVVDVVDVAGPDGTPVATVQPVDVGPADVWTVHGVRWVTGARWIDSETAAREVATYDGAGSDGRRYDLEHEPGGYAVELHGRGVRYVTTGDALPRWSGDRARPVRVDLRPGTFYPACTSAELADAAGVQGPDEHDHYGRPGSPGARWLRGVERAYHESTGYHETADEVADALYEVAGGTVPDSTWERWRVWADLCVWQNVDTVDRGDGAAVEIDGMPMPVDPSEMAGAALAKVARGLLVVLHEHYSEHTGPDGTPVDGCTVCTAARLSADRVAAEQRDGTAYVGAPDPATTVPAT